MTGQLDFNGFGDGKPHFVLVPLMAQGHMIPMVDLGLLLADRGVTVSLITTPFNASRIITTIDQAREAGLPIRFVELPFPFAEVGLPEGLENIDAATSMEPMSAFFRATSLLRRPLEQYLREQSPYPSCIISDLCHPWTLEVARNLQVPRLTFFSICCFTLLCIHNIWYYKVYDDMPDEHESFVVPGLAERIEVTKAQAPGFFDMPGWEKMAEEVREAEFAADGIVVNSFRDLEPIYIESYQKAMQKKVWTVGPFSLRNKSVAAMAARGNRASIDTEQCLSWLDSKKPMSVVYVSFGSLTKMNSSQLMEISLGLEASNHPFVLVIKKSETSEKVEEWMAAGFEERIGSRALVIRGWSPQVMILSHPSVGGFMTHCGWNSTLESITAGVPMITWPHFADQFLNERMVVDVLRIGVSLGVKEPTYWGTEAGHSAVSRDDVERAVRSLMDEGEEGRERRLRAKELGEKANEAMEEGGSSRANMTHLIEHYTRHAMESMESNGD
ncbi:UDP-glycosyltransferase 73C6-like [Musa acuminata AAA Group]|uniref:UDP-glycosyltransferase 73C6-like n=1 Tax=Musa acuminata AAA Group TaxID=214697 RepID=UPI0031D1A116